MYTGQLIYCGRRADLSIGNVLPIGTLPEGTVICNVEGRVGDRGALARCSGDYAIVISHNTDNGATRLLYIYLPPCMHDAAFELMCNHSN